MADMNSNTKGELAKQMVCCDLISQGFEVTRSQGNFHWFDFVVLVENKNLLIKVKTASPQNSGVYVHAPKNGNFHILAVCDITTGSIVYVYRTKRTGTIMSSN